MRANRTQCLRPIFARVVLLAAGLLGLAHAAAAQMQPGQGTSRPSPQTPQAGEPGQAGLPVFEFHSGFWINLHHFLYQQARLRKLPARAAAAGSSSPAASGTSPSRGDSTPRPADAAPASLDSLPSEEQQAWSAALDFYAGDLSERDLLVNGDMVNIKDRLEEMETCADLSGRSSRECASGLRQELVAALERAAPVYRARWWAEQDRANRAWIAGVGPLVRQMGAGLAQQLAAVYHADWPAGRLRVDVVAYAGSLGAYTTLDPVRLTISSADARNQGLAAFELLFHEASHALARSVRDAIIRECRQRGKPVPRDLWHALLFYTTGEVVRRALEHDAGARASAAGYTPYAYRNGLFDRGWSNYQRGLERFWQPYLDGKTDFDAAVARLVSAL